MQDSKYIKDTMLSMTDHQLLTTTAGDHFVTSFPTYSPINSDPQVSQEPSNYRLNLAGAIHPAKNLNRSGIWSQLSRMDNINISDMSTELDNYRYSLDMDI